MSGLDSPSFFISQLPVPPARVLEVGCGTGDLALALSGVGHDVLAIDPVAPVGSIFRRTSLEELDDAGPFDAVVASLSLHHVHDLEAALDKIAALAPLVVIEEFAWERFDENTADWYERQRRVLVSQAPPAAGWHEAHAGLHTGRMVRGALESRFEERHFEWIPYLHRYLGGPSTETLESGLIAARAIRALGFRYVGLRR